MVLSATSISCEADAVEAAKLEVPDSEALLTADGQQEGGEPRKPSHSLLKED
jgi:hypothetical protein